jgi:tetratricopeptide (TPR) repeat protein
VKPSRGTRREYQFSFQDLITLRAARTLIDANVPRRRIRRALDDLRRHLPDEAPLSGLSISAVGEQVVVREGRNHFQACDGQYLLGLGVEVDSDEVRIVDHKPPRAPAVEPPNWFARGLELEGSDPAAALEAYERATEANAEDASAWINWGRLLHEQGRLTEAEGVYRRAREHCEPDAVLMFNFGVLLEDLGRTGPALEAYMVAIGNDPTLADCHYNLARLYEAAGKTQHAIRHLGEYRRLTGGSDT